MSRSIMRKIQQLLDCEDEDRRATLAGELAIEIAGQPDLVHRLVLTLCEAVSAYRAERAKIEELAQSLRTGPNPCVPVIERLESNGTIQLLVSRHGELIRVGLPPEELAQIDVAALVPGARVFLSSDYSVVVGADGQPYDMGEEATVVSVDGNGRALVDFGGGTGKRWVRLGAELLWNRDQLKPGVRVLGSSRIGLVVGIAPQPDEPVAEPEQQPRVKFAGHRRLRDQLERWLIKPLRAPEQFLAGRELSMGMAGFPICILLKGPTGVGKTHAARWAAQEAGARLIEVQPADVRNSYFGASENAIRSYIEQAAEWVRAKQGRRAVVVFNEVESLLLERSRAGDSSVYSTLLAIVDSYLNSIDRLRQFYASQPIAVVLTTNLPYLLDPAATGPHRAHCFEVGYLDPDEIEEVAVALLEDVPCGHPGEIASRLADFLAADGMPALEVSLDGRPMTIELGEIVSPALIGGIVKSAAMRAFDERPEDARVTWRHVAAAIDEVVPEYLDRIAGAGQQALATTLPRYAAGRVGHIRVAYRAQPALRL